MRGGALSVDYAELLGGFANLRNAISHGPHHGGHVIAEPVPEVVEQIERLREQILHPPMVTRLLPPRPVAMVSPSDPLSQALDLVRVHDYSQIPVYDAAVYVGLLSSNCVARWLAANLRRAGAVPEARVGDALTFAEPQDRAVFVRATISAPEAVRLLSEPMDLVAPHPRRCC